MRSIANLVACLGAEIDFRVITWDRDLGDATTYEGVEPGIWTDVGHAKVLYLSPQSFRFRSIYRLLASQKADVLYLNSFFNTHVSILPMLARAMGARGQDRVVFAPRGEFSLGALQISKVRKSMWMALALRMEVYRTALWQASSAFEEQDIRRVFGRYTRFERTVIAVASDMPLRYGADSEGGSLPRCVKVPGTLRIVFLSRISPIKNLLGAIRMLRGLAGSIEFNIYGPAEDAGYFSQCETELRALPTNIRVGIQSEVEHAQVREVIARHHVFFLPSLGENFGHVIYEALSAGVPAIISDRTPWRGLEERGAGWDLPLEREDLFREALETCVAMDNELFTAASESAKAMALRFAEDDKVTADNRALFLPAVATNLTHGDSGIPAGQTS